MFYYSSYFCISVCVLCVRACMHAGVCACTPVCVSACVRTCVRACVRSCVHACVWVTMLMSECVCAGMLVLCVCLHVRVARLLKMSWCRLLVNHTHIYTRTHVHKRSNTHKCRNVENNVAVYIYLYDIAEGTDILQLQCVYITQIHTYTYTHTSVE